MKRLLFFRVVFSAVFLLVSAASLASPLGVAAGGASALARPAGLERDINFWRRIYTEVSTNEGFVHDDRRLDIVYETVHLPKNASNTARRAKARAAANKYSTMLVAIAKKNPSALSGEEKRVRALWGEDVDAAQLREASRRVRFQLGQSDKFREGIVRSGAWQEYIRKTLAAARVPPEVAYLPHVESSFNPVARSHVGAVGMWQFMPSTGRRYMRIDHVIDERLDPYRSSEAAALLMQHNYEVTNNWPLAITAYNHGASGMRRAIKQVGTDDIERVVRTYRSRTFGFASRNFYVALLAAVDVAGEYERYFGPITLNPPDTSEVIEVPGYVPASRLAVALGVDSETLARWNPSLLRPVWDGTKLVPKGYVLRVPPRDGVDARALLAGLPSGEWRPHQTPDLFHVVQRGETLSSIAPRYGARVSDLVAMNGLPSQHRIRIGQRLVLPAAKGVTTEAVVDEGVYSQAAEAANPPAATVIVAAAAPEPPAAIANASTVPVEPVAAPVVEVPVAEVPPPGTPVAVAVAPSEPALGEAESLVVAEAETSLPAEAGAPLIAGIPPSGATDAATQALPAPGIGAEPVVSPVDAAVVLVPELKADPSDYLVADDGSIRIQDGESLGHFADWLGISASALRRLNGLGGRSVIKVGKPLKLDFSRVTREVFEQRRMGYHQVLQEAFFARHRIAGTNEHVVRRGESVWVLAERQYKVPVWLLRQYNPDVDLALLRPGARVVIPVLIDREVEPADGGRPS